MGQAGACNELVGRRKVAQCRAVGDAGQRLADRLEGGCRQHANRDHDVRMRLIGLVEHYAIFVVANGNDPSPFETQLNPAKKS